MSVISFDPKGQMVLECTDAFMQAAQERLQTMRIIAVDDGIFYTEEPEGQSFSQTLAEERQELCDKLMYFQGLVDISQGLDALRKEVNSSSVQDFPEPRKIFRTHLEALVLKEVFSDHSDDLPRARAVVDWMFDVRETLRPQEHKAQP